MKKYLILDLDHTIALAGERNIFYALEPRNYAAAEAGVIHDGVIEPTKKVVQLFYKSNYDVIVLTARAASCKEQCIEWLNNNEIPFNDIFMRPIGNYEKDYVIKEILLKDIKMKYGHPEFALEDKEDVVEMFKRNGVFTFAIHQPRQL